MHGIPDAVHNADCVRSAALLEYRNVDRVLAVNPDNICLQLPRIYGLSDIPNEDGCAGCRLDWHGIDFINHGNLAVGVYVVILRSNTHIPRRKNQIRLIHRVDNVHHGQLMCLQLHRIDIDLDLPVLAAVGLGNR